MTYVAPERELVEFCDNQPFVLIEIFASAGYDVPILNHWHDELEVVYITRGACMHHIDGRSYKSKSGSVIVTNCSSVHSIIPDKLEGYDNKLNAIVLQIDRKFLNENILGFEYLYFTNNLIDERSEIKQTLLEIHKYYHQATKGENDILYIKSLLFKLLYFLLEENPRIQSEIEVLKVDKNICRIKEVINYIEANYQLKLRQEEVAKRFFFTPEYFSRYFKSNTGMTFTEYLTKYRLIQAVDELIKTDNSITNIAMNNGFSDDRRFIICFKRNYNTTPLQYRKNYKK